MCGLAGLLGAALANLAAAMDAALRHRGPDAGGTFADPDAHILLVHRRLAILDLSPTGAQPMADRSGRFVISYNGEIYNHRELRVGLEAKGIVFRGHSDTETIVEAFAARGPDSFADLNGIFALAIWDRKERSLTIARDGAGTKPLYWTQGKEGFAFASEIKALLRLPWLDRTLDPIALRAYLAYLWSPGERTALAAVRKLAPGTWLRIGADGRRESGRFYDLPAYRPRNGMTAAQAIAGTRTHLAGAVERQMLSDVEVGAFLSGGLDSSAIVHFARDHVKGRLQCFTIGYREKREEAGEIVADLPYARRAARHLGVELNEIEVSASMANDLEALAFTLDEPEADPAALNNLYIAALARRHGIKVLLSGAGGDDVFTGYRRHRLAAHDGLIGLLPSGGIGLAGAVAKRLGRDRAARGLAKIARTARGNADERLMRSFEWLDLDEVETLLRAPLEGAQTAVRAPMRQVLAGADGPPIERLLRLEQSFFLADHNLNYTDKTGMAHGVEIRVPYLDKELMAWAAQVPTNFKLRRGETKWVLRKAMEGLLPDDIIYRPKSGFGVPLRAWLRDGLREMLEDLTSPAVVDARGLFDPAAVAALREATLAGKTDGSYTLLALMMTELWCRNFVDAPDQRGSVERTRCATVGSSIPAATGQGRSLGMS